MSHSENTAATSTAAPAPAPINEGKLWRALEAVHDPELEVDIVNLGLVYELRILGDSVSALMTLTTMGCPAQEEIELAVVAALLSVEGVEGVEVQWTFDPPWTPDRLTEEGRDLLISLGYL
jgi:metal-sulfur cluster biosynthetic enzyme